MNTIDINDFLNTIIPNLQAAIVKKANAQNIALSANDLETLTTNLLIQNNNPANLHDTFNDYITKVFDQTTEVDQPIKLIEYQPDQYTNLNN